MADDLLAAQHDRAVAAQRFAQRGQLQQPGGVETGFGHAAAPVRTDHADAVGVVDIHQRLLHARDQRQFAQRRDIAVHAEHAVGGEHRHAVGHGAQLAQCAFGIGVRIAAQFAAGKPRGVDQTGVIQTILHADVFFAQQRLHHRKVGEVAAAEQQRARGAQPVGELAFQRVVMGVMTADQMRGAAAGTIARCAGLQRVDHCEMLREAEIIVAAEVGQPAAVDFVAHPVAAGDRTALSHAALHRALQAGGEETFGQARTGHDDASVRRRGCRRGRYRPHRYACRTQQYR